MVEVYGNGFTAMIDSPMEADIEDKISLNEYINQLKYSYDYKNMPYSPVYKQIFFI